MKDSRQLDEKHNRDKDNLKKTWHSRIYVRRQKRDAINILMNSKISIVLLYSVYRMQFPDSLSSKGGISWNHKQKIRSDLRLWERGPAGQEISDRILDTVFIELSNLEDLWAAEDDPVTWQHSSDPTKTKRVKLMWKVWSWQRQLLWRYLG